MNATDGLRMSKSLTIAYIVALTAIAASSLVAHGLLDRVIARTQTSSTIINIPAGSACYRNGLIYLRIKW